MAYVKRITIHKTLLKSLQYIENHKKTNEKILVSSNKCSQDEKVAIKEMMLLKKSHGKEDGIQGFHFIQSFKKGEVSEDVAHQMGKEWAAKFLDDNYQYVLSTHNDKDHIHNHIVINSVGLNGKKYNSCVNEREDIRRYSDLVCLEHGLSIIERKGKIKYRSYKEWLESKNKTSWKDTIREDIDYAISSSASFEEFIKKMKSEGYYMKYGEKTKYMTYEKSGMKKAVRGKTLGEDYSEERIRERIRYKEYNIGHHKSKHIRRYKIDIYDYEYQIRRLTYRPGSLNTSIRLIVLLFQVVFRNNRLSYEKDNRPVKYTYAQKRAIEGIKDLTNSLNLLDKYNLKTRSDVRNEKQRLNEKIVIEDEKLKKFDSLKIKSAAIVTEIEMFNKYKKYYQEYQSSILKAAYKKKHEYELEKFESCKGRLRKFGLEESEFEKFKKSYEKISEQMEEVQVEKEKIYDELFEIEKLDKYLDNEKRDEILKEIMLEREEENNKEKKER